VETAQAVDAAHLPSSTHFRTVLGHLPTGVVVVTAAAPHGPVGMVIGSFTSVSLDPPLVGFLPDRSSTTFPHLHATGSFCVNILSEHQIDHCRTFARKGGDKFDGVSWKPAPASGAPILNGVVAWIDCEIFSVQEIGDHFMVIGAVRALNAGVAAAPLLFCRGTLGAALDSA
jgi:flavin reductase (DIM6/NTAB) family NADH-FMN oxidoreductase RutF